MREGDQLQRQIRADLLLDLQQGAHGEQPVVADIDVAADGQQAAADGPVAVAQGALHQGVLVQRGLEFAPQRDAFQQRAAGIDARQAVAQRRVQVEVGVDEGGAEQMAFGLEFGRAGGDGELRADGGEQAGIDQHVVVGAAIGQGDVAQAEHGMDSRWQPGRLHCHVLVTPVSPAGTRLPPFLMIEVLR